MRIYIFLFLVLSINFLSVSQGETDQPFLLGVDLSYVNELEACGANYSNKDGEADEPYSIFSSAGANIVRLRLWHNPDWTNYGNLEDVKTSVSRAKNAGMQVLLDFHYSDFWADPGRQWRPAAWEDIDNNEILGDSVFNYTTKVLTELHQQNLTPDFVQIGNETNIDVLQPRNGVAIDNESPDKTIDWSRQVALLQDGINAVIAFNESQTTEIKTVLHVANPKNAIWWFESAVNNGLENFDIIGLSYYPQWHKLGVREVGEHITQLKNEYSKDVMIVETGYPWTNDSLSDNAGNVLGLDSRLFTFSSSFSIETQRDFLIELTWLVKESGGLGVIYWEPAWLSTSCQTFWATGSHWENATFFDFDGRLHAGADFLSYDYSVMPSALENQPVTFIVDMTNIATDNGVFVTGSFTGDPWKHLAMNLTQNNLYLLETSIPGRSTGSYIFYNDDVWTDEARETVPDECALTGGSFREYRIKNEAVTFYVSRGRCDTQPNPILNVPDQINNNVLAYPTITDGSIQIFSKEKIMDIKLFDLAGSEMDFDTLSDGQLSLNKLRKGVYILKIETPSGIEKIKLFRE